MTFNWNKAEEQFVDDRIIKLPVQNMKELIKRLPYRCSDKRELQILNLMIDDQIRTLLYSIQRVMIRYSYIERVGNLKC